MKQKDWALIAAVVVVSIVVALLVSNMVIAPPKNRKEQVEVVDIITDEFNPPSSKYFNEQSVDPTKVIQIGDDQNPAPFNTGN